MEKKLLLGNEAVAQGLYEAGVKVVSSYPGTPSTEITEAVSKYDEIYSEWAPNEKVAFEVAVGAPRYALLAERVGLPSSRYCGEGAYARACRQSGGA